MSRRPWWIWIVPSVALFIVLVAQNAFLFSTKMYEQGDSAADSILIQQAMRFRLLVGHYSREGFNHPGPAYLYIQAFGQWLAHDVLGIVPTPWNGQFLAVFAFNSAMAAIAVAIVYGWTNSLRAAAATFAVVCALISLRTLVPVSGWPPNMFVLTYLVFMLSVASVASGHARDLWVLALSGWLLIHGYAPFLFFVPLTVVVAAAIALWPDRRHPLVAIRASISARRRAWLPVAVISAVFLFPIVLNLILHWPGQFGKYIDYSKSGQAGGHTPQQVWSFFIWYWGPGPVTITLLVACAVIAPFVTRRLPPGPLRRCLNRLLVVAAVTTLTFLLYAFTAADYLSNHYIGYFYWAVPFVPLLVILVSLAQAFQQRVATVLALLTAAGMLAVLSFVVVLRTDVHDNDTMLSQAVASLAARSHGKELVLDVEGPAWPQTLGFLLQAERTGVRVCVTDSASIYLVVTEEFTCTSQEEATGARYAIVDMNDPDGIVQFGTTQSSYVTVFGG